MLSSDPWVITIDNFLSHDECDAIVGAGSSKGSAWERSKAGDGVQAARTSSTAWCKGECLRNPAVQAVEQRTSRLSANERMGTQSPAADKSAGTARHQPEARMARAAGG